MSSSWQHDSSGISSLDTIHSGLSHLSRSTLDRHIWDAVARQPRQSQASSLSETLLYGLLRHPQTLAQVLEYLPVHLADALFTNIQHAWPPESLCKTSVAAPFNLWLHSVAAAQAYDGLVLRDAVELGQLVALDCLTCLDLVDAQIDDALCVEIKNVAGKTVRALRISSTKITDMGIRKMTASLPENFQQLVMLSTYGSRGITDRAMVELLKFPKLACIDLRGTSATSAAVRIASNTSSTFAFKPAPPRDRTLTQPTKPLIRSCQELERLLRLPSKRKAVVTKIQRDMQLTATEEKRPKVKDTYTPAFGNFYSTSALSRELLLQDASDLTAKGRAFRSNFGGEVAGGRITSGPRKPFTLENQLGLQECLELWSKGEWDRIMASEKHRKELSHMFRASIEPEQGAEESRLLDGPVLLRKLPPENTMEHQFGAPDKQAAEQSNVHLKSKQRFGKPIPEPIQIRHTATASACTSNVTSLSLLGVKNGSSAATESRQAKKARLDKILPPSLTESPSSVRRALPDKTTSQQGSRSALGSMGSLSQKRSSLGAFRKSQAFS